MIRLRHAECAWTRVKVGRKLVGNFPESHYTVSKYCEISFLGELMSLAAHNSSNSLYLKVFKENATVVD